MQAKMIPAKRLTVSGKVSTYRVTDSPVSYFVPSLSDVQAHLASDGALIQSDSEDAKKQLEASGIPLFNSEVSNWLMTALNAAAQVKARGGFEVTGDTPEDLQVRIGNLPQSMDDLLASDRAGGPYMKQKAAFLEGFRAWAESGALKRPKQFITALARPSLTGTNVKAYGPVQRAVQMYLDHLALSDKEQAAAFGVYLNALDRQLNAEQEEEDWDDMPG